MPTPPVPSRSFLTSKMGPFPVWGWAGGGLGAALLYSHYKQGKTAKDEAKSATSTTAYVPGSGAVGEPATGAPYFVIENNMPPTPGAAPSAPIIQPTAPPPAVTPPGTTPSPPTNNTPPPVVPPRTDPTPPANPRPNIPVPPVFTPPPTSHAPTPPPAPAPKPMVAAHTYKVVAGDTLAKIAAANNISGGWQALWAYQLDPKNNPASQIATLRARGPNLLYPGETIRIPAHY